MTSARYLPPIAVAKALWLLLTGRIRLPKDRVGMKLVMDNGEEHTIFREIQVDTSRSAPPESLTVLKVRFAFARFSPAANRRLSLFPIPVIAGMPGFSRKVWTFCGKNGYSQGLYQFESPEQAEGYGRSPVMKILEKRSVPGSTTLELFPGTLIDDYLDSQKEAGNGR